LTPLLLKRAVAAPHPRRAVCGPARWTVIVAGCTFEVFAGTPEAAEKIAARRIAQGKL
jgi:hypothetical protein